MKIAGIIAEYNPFHNGHAFHLAETKRLGEADGVIVVMSGDFTQRGEPALIDKTRRAAMALAGGADVVLELPVEYATGSAENFARGGVETLAACGCVDVLSFGCEARSLAELEAAQNALVEPAAQEALRRFLKEGRSYPAAMQAALDECAPQAAGVLREPNNVLGIEYLHARGRLPEERRIPEVLAVPRTGAGHREEELEISGGSTYIASATAIRRALLQGVPAEALGDYLPPESTAGLDYALGPESLALPLFARLNYLSREEMTAFEDVNEELAARIEAALPKARTWAELVELAATRAYTQARVRRALLHILLQLPKGCGQESPRALKILGLRKGSPVAALLKANAVVPVITKTADDRADLLRASRLAASFYNRLVSAAFPAQEPPKDDYYQSPVVF